VRRQRRELQVIGAQLEAAGQLDRAHHGVDGQLRADQLGLRSQERVVEADVVRDEGAVLQQLDEVADDVAEAGLALEHLGG
jgi:hypothetical protein